MVSLTLTDAQVADRFERAAHLIDQGWTPRHYKASKLSGGYMYCAVGALCEVALNCDEEVALEAILHGEVRPDFGSAEAWNYSAGQQGVKDKFLEIANRHKTEPSL